MLFGRSVSAVQKPGGLILCNEDCPDCFSCVKRHVEPCRQTSHPFSLAPDRSHPASPVPRPVPATPRRPVPAQKMGRPAALLLGRRSIEPSKNPGDARSLNLGRSKYTIIHHPLNHHQVQCIPTIYRVASRPPVAPVEVGSVGLGWVDASRVQSYRS